MTVKVEFAIKSVELKVKYLYNYLNAAAICLRTSATQFSVKTSVNLNIRTNHKPQNSDGNTTKYRVLSIMPKIPKILVGIQMERSISVPSDRNIRDHLWRWSTYLGSNIPIEIHRSIFDKPVLCPN